MSTFYTPGPKGYIDYPTLAARAASAEVMKRGVVVKQTGARVD